MNLTFKGFLRFYCRELTGLQTDNLKKLCHATVDKAPAAAEAVMVFAAIQGKASYLATVSEGLWMEASYREMARCMDEPEKVIPFLLSEEAPSAIGACGRPMWRSATPFSWIGASSPSCARKPWPPWRRRGLRAIAFPKISA